MQSYAYFAKGKIYSGGSDSVTTKSDFTTSGETKVHSPIEWHNPLYPKESSRGQEAPKPHSVLAEKRTQSSLQSPRVRTEPVSKTAKKPTA